MDKKVQNAAIGAIIATGLTAVFMIFVFFQFPNQKHIANGLKQ